MMMSQGVGSQCGNDVIYTGAEPAGQGGEARCQWKDNRKSYPPRPDTRMPRQQPPKPMISSLGSQKPLPFLPGPALGPSDVIFWSSRSPRPHRDPTMTSPVCRDLTLQFDSDLTVTP